MLLYPGQRLIWIDLEGAFGLMPNRTFKVSCWNGQGQRWDVVVHAPFAYDAVRTATGEEPMGGGSPMLTGGYAFSVLSDEIPQTVRRVEVRQIRSARPG